MNEFNLPPFCKKNEEICNCKITCYPFLLMKKLQEESKIPKKYWDCTPENLPIEKENPITYKHILRYMENITENVMEKGIGLYLYSISDKENILGTGIGKTSTACTIANYYIKKRVVEHIKKTRKLETNPVLFLSVATLQNIYNSQFGGSIETKEEAADTFQNLLQMAIKTEMLVLDDVALRSADTFLNFLYQIIDTRNTESRTIIVTSNIPVDKTNEILGDRICSRLQECTFPFGFTGRDHRRRFF